MKSYIAENAEVVLSSEEQEAADLYVELSKEKYSNRPYNTSDLGDDMSEVCRTYGEYWKIRYLMDHRNKRAYEFLTDDLKLCTIEMFDIAWETLRGVPEDVMSRARRRSASYPTIVRRFQDNVGFVEWQVNPDGRYFMDDDGYGMTDDEEVALCGYIDRTGSPLVKFRVVSSSEEYKEMEAEARKKIIL